jgi:hypothetical protein
VISDTQTTWNSIAIEIFIEDPSTVLNPSSTVSSNFEELTYDSTALPDGATAQFFLHTASSPNVKMLRCTFTPGTAYSSIQSFLRTLTYRVKYGQQPGIKTIYYVIQDITSPIKWSKQTIRTPGWPGVIARPRGLRFYRIVQLTSPAFATVSNNVAASRNDSYFGLTNGYLATTYTSDELVVAKSLSPSSNITGTTYLFLGATGPHPNWIWLQDPDGYSNLSFSSTFFPPWEGESQPNTGELFYGLANHLTRVPHDLPDSFAACRGYIVMYRGEDCLNKVQVRVIAQNSLLHLRPL